jgi:hypothetical protein
MSKATLIESALKPQSVPAEQRASELFLENEMLRIAKLLQAESLPVPCKLEFIEIVKEAWLEASLRILSPWAVPACHDIRQLVNEHVRAASVETTTKRERRKCM